MNMWPDSVTLLVIACAVVTYLTRVSGHLILSRFGKVNHRVEAALDAVPTAVLAALVAPSLVTNGWAETLAIVVAGLVAARFSLITAVAAGLIALVLLRLI